MSPHEGKSRVSLFCVAGGTKFVSSVIEVSGESFSRGVCIKVNGCAVVVS